MAIDGLGNKGEYQTTVQSDYDGYNESFTQNSNDTYHVDTHATASASASVTPPIPWTSTSNNINANADTEDKQMLWMTRNLPDMDVYVDIYITSGSYNGGEIDVKVYNGSGTHVGGARVASDNSSASWSGVINGITKVVNFNDNSTGTQDGNIDLTVELRPTKSATIDSKSVVTDDIHK